VNAAFLLVATAWATGADAAPTPAAPTVAAPVAAAPIASAPGGSCCGGGGGCGGGCGSSCCDTCCNECCCKPSLFERLSARFRKSSCCDCCDTCGSGCGSTCGGCGTHGGCGTSCGGCGTSCGGCNTCNTCNTCDTCCNECCCKPSLFERLSARFRKSSCCDCCDTCGGGCGTGCGGCGGGYGGAAVAPGTVVPGAMPPAGEKIGAPKDTEPGKLPTGPGKVQAPLVPVITPAASRTIDTGANNNPFELDRRYESRVDRAADYSWVTGQLFYVHADGGLWVLRYAPMGKEDPNGGSVVLARDRQMDSYREGDLVTVHGEIINQKSSIFLGGPLYRASSIQLVERSQR
jgi:hypothetical protein